MLTNIHNVAAEGNFCNEGGKALKPQIVTDYNHHMGYVDKGDRILLLLVNGLINANMFIRYKATGMWHFVVG